MKNKGCTATVPNSPHWNLHEKLRQLLHWNGSQQENPETIFGFFEREGVANPKHNFPLAGHTLQMPINPILDCQALLWTIPKYAGPNSGMFFHESTPCVTQCDCVIADFVCVLQTFAQPGLGTTHHSHTQSPQANSDRKQISNRKHDRFIKLEPFLQHLPRFCLFLLVDLHWPPLWRSRHVIPIFQTGPAGLQPERRAWPGSGGPGAAASDGQRFRSLVWAKAQQPYGLAKTKIISCLYNTIYIFVYQKSMCI